MILVRKGKARSQRTTPSSLVATKSSSLVARAPTYIEPSRPSKVVVKTVTEPPQAKLAEVVPSPPVTKEPQVETWPKVGDTVLHPTRPYFASGRPNIYSIRAILPFADDGEAPTVLFGAGPGRIIGVHLRRLVPHIPR